jgi:translation initiation factor eIF-2B subunit epsilon
MQVEASVIGRNCHIGKGAVVVGSYLLDGVRVQPQARVTHSLLCDSVVIKGGASVKLGSILSFKVLFPPIFPPINGSDRLLRSPL